MWPSSCGFRRNSLHRNALQKCPVETEPSEGTETEIEDVSRGPGTTLDSRSITQMTTVGSSRMEPRFPTKRRLRKCGGELAWAFSTAENNLPDHFVEVPTFESHVLPSILVMTARKKEMI